jgi:hypothetical protein
MDQEALDAGSWPHLGLFRPTLFTLLAHKHGIEASCFCSHAVVYFALQKKPRHT